MQPARSGMTLLNVVVIFLVVFVLAIVLFPIFSHAKTGDGRSSCRSNLKQLDLAFEMYLMDSEDVYPPTVGWADGIYPYIKNRQIYGCPLIKRSPNEYGYAYREAIANHDLRKIDDPAMEVALFESRDLSWNAHGGLSLLPFAPRHNSSDNYAMADGHVRAMTRAQAAHLHSKTP